MICPSASTECAFFRSDLLRDVSEKARSCCHGGLAEGQFAAVDAFVASIDVPYVDSTGMMSTPSPEFDACTCDRISLVSTLVMLVSSYDNVRNVIVFDDNAESSASLVKSVDAVRRDFNTGITCVISCVKGNKDMYSVSVSTALQPVVVNSEGLASVVKQYMNTDYTLTWIKSPECLDLAAALQHRHTHMWVNDTGTAAKSVSLTGADGTRILPLMYTRPEVCNVVSVNFGFSRPEITLRPEDVALLINTTARQFLTAGTKERKCYFCAMMSAIHDAACPATNRTAKKYDFQLTEFVENILTG